MKPATASAKPAVTPAKPAAAGVAAAPQKPGAAAANAAPAAPAAPPAPPTSVRKMDEAIAKQKAAVLKQAPAPPSGSLFSGEFFSVGWSWDPPPLPAPQQPDCPPMAEGEVDTLVAAAATAQSLQPELIKAVIRQESAFHPCAVSVKGAMGLMQIMPATADQFQVADPFDPAQNIRAGSLYLKQLLDRYQGDTKLALAAYNAGPSRVDEAGKTTPDIPETQDYVNRIMETLKPAPAKTP